MLTLIRLYLHWSATRAAYATLVGHAIDAQHPEKGRLTRVHVQDLLKQLWRNFDLLLPEAHLERYGSLGNRQNVMLSLLSIAAYRALVDAGFEKSDATTMFADMGWQVYQSMLKVPRFFARLLFRDPQQQMNFILRMLLIYPFNYSPGGYQGKAWKAQDGFYTHWYRCPALEYVKTQGKPDEVDFFYRTWCQFDYAAAQAMAQNGRFERPHCLPQGDEVCDMRWYVEAGVGTS